MTERACFTLARPTGAIIKSETAQGDTYQVAPGQRDRLAAEVVVPHGGGLQPQDVAHPDKGEWLVLLRGGEPLQVLLILADHRPGLLTAAVLGLRELVADLKEVSQHLLEKGKDGHEPRRPYRRGRPLGTEFG
jgi:hypothetical protein